MFAFKVTRNTTVVTMIADDNIVFEINARFILD